MKAVDDASKVISEASSKVSNSLDSINKSGNSVSDSQKKVTASSRNIVTGFSGVATASFSLYNAYDRVSDMQVSVNKANLQVKSSTNSVEDAQRRVTTTAEALETAHEAVAQATEQYGFDSDQAAAATIREETAARNYEAALPDLQLSQERLTVATERAEMVQGNMNEAMVQSALQVVPTVITAIDSGSKLYKSLGSLGDITSKVKDTLASWKDVDFSTLLTKIGIVDTSLKGLAVTAGTVAGVIGGLAYIGYVGATTTEAKTQKALTPPGLPEMPLRPGQTEAPFGMPSLDIGKKISDWLNSLFGGGGKVPVMAEGGIVTQPTYALIGEAGPELVVPISKISNGVINASFLSTIPRMAEGGIIFQPSLVMAGEAGPEIVLPLKQYEAQITKSKESVTESLMRNNNYVTNIVKTTSLTERIPHFAAGGIVRERTLIVAGEAGPEAVIPLSQLSESSLTVNVYIENAYGETVEELARKGASEGIAESYRRRG